MESAGKRTETRSLEAINRSIFLMEAKLTSDTLLEIQHEIEVDSQKKRKIRRRHIQPLNQNINESAVVESRFYFFKNIVSKFT